MSTFLANWGFSHDVTEIQTTKLMILLRFYFHDVYDVHAENEYSYTFIRMECNLILGNYLLSFPKFWT